VALPHRPGRHLPAIGAQDDGLTPIVADRRVIDEGQVRSVSRKAQIREQRAAAVDLFADWKLERASPTFRVISNNRQRRTVRRVVRRLDILDLRFWCTARHRSPRERPGCQERTEAGGRQGDDHIVSPDRQEGRILDLERSAAGLVRRHDEKLWR